MSQIFKQIQGGLTELEKGIRSTPEGTDLSAVSAGLTDLENMLRTQIKEAPKLTIPEPEVGVSPPESSQRIIDTTPQQWFTDQEAKRQQELDRLAAEREKADAERKSLIEKVGDFFTGRESTEDILRREREAMGMQDILQQQQATISEIQRLRESAIALLEQRDASLSVGGQMGIETAFMTREQARIAEAYDRRISSITAREGSQLALFQAQQGLVQQARALVGDIVDAYTYDTKMELTKLEMFLDFNREEISMLDKSYQRELQESKQYWADLLKQERDEKEVALKGMIEFHEAGITATDTPEQVAKKIAAWKGVQPDELVVKLAMEYPGVVNPEMTLQEALTAISEIPYQPEWKTQVIDGSVYRFDPRTGDYDLLVPGTSPAALAAYKHGLSKDLAVFKEGIKGTQEQIKAEEEDKEIDSWANLFLQEEVTVSQIPQAIRNKVIETANKLDPGRQIKSLAEKWMEEGRKKQDFLNEYKNANSDLLMALPKEERDRVWNLVIKTADNVFGIGAIEGIGRLFGF